MGRGGGCLVGIKIVWWQLKVRDFCIEIVSLPPSIQSWRSAFEDRSLRGRGCCRKECS